MTVLKVELKPLKPQEQPDFCQRLQQAFAKAVVENFGPLPEPIPNDRELQEAFAAPGAVAYHIMHEGQKVGGVLLSIDKQTRHNSLDLFFVDTAKHSQGLGLAAWQAVEAAYPETLVWETITPYFEQRNIHFYVNKCGFHIVEFFNEHHPEPDMPQMEAGGEIPGCDASFRFEKVMPVNK